MVCSIRTCFNVQFVDLDGRIYFKHNSFVSWSVILFPDPTTHARKASGDIGSDSWFCKLSNHVIICCIGAHVIVCKTKKTHHCPQTLSSRA